MNTVENAGHVAHKGNVNRCRTKTKPEFPPRTFYIVPPGASKLLNMVAADVRRLGLGLILDAQWN